MSPNPPPKQRNFDHGPAKILMFIITIIIREASQLYKVGFNVPELDFSK